MMMIPMLLWLIFCYFWQSPSDGGGGSGVGGDGGGGHSIDLGKTSASGYKWRLVISYDGTRYSGGYSL